MFNSTFYHSTIRRYVATFGTMFNEIYINRNDPTTGVTTTMKVPLFYGPKDKALARLDSNPELNNPIALTLPRMGFEMTTVSYDPTRKLQTITKNIKYGDGKMTRQYVPVPYNISFTLYVMVKNADDGTQIAEQILPYFTPDWTPTVNLIPEMDIKMDIPVVILNTTIDDSYEGNFDQRRVMTWTFDFLLKGYIFGPVKENKVITSVDVNFLDAIGYDTAAAAVGNGELDAKVNIVPGLLANGSPTTNASLTIDRSLISANDNYGYVTTKT